MEKSLDCSLLSEHTVSSFNFCTKHKDSPGIIHDRTPDYHPVVWAWMRPKVPDLTTERSFDLQATLVIGVLWLTL